MNRVALLRTAAAVLTAGLTSAVMANASLTLTPTGGTCVTESFTFYGNVASELYSSAPCSATSGFFVASSSSTIGSYQSFMQLTYAYSYHDDGLALSSPVSLISGGYGSSPSTQATQVTFESATLSVDVLSGQFAPLGGYIVQLGAAPDDPLSTGLSWVDGDLFFGLNNVPDDLSGTLTVRIGVTALNMQDVGVVSGVNLAPSVAAVPEPATVALLLSGLAPLAWARRRRVVLARALSPSR